VNGLLACIRQSRGGTGKLRAESLGEKIAPSRLVAQPSSSARLEPTNAPNHSPDVVPDALVRLELPSFVIAEPSTELLKVNALDVLRRRTGPQPQEDRIDFGLVLVGVGAEVDALRIPRKEETRDTVVYLAVLATKLSPLRSARILSLSAVTPVCATILPFSGGREREPGGRLM
jgi:hypothetical protein